MSYTKIKRTEPKPFSWKLRVDLKNILFKSDIVKVTADLHDITVMAEQIMQVLDEKYGVKLDYQEQWICDWKPKEDKYRHE